MPDYATTARKNGPGSDIRVNVSEVDGTIVGLPWAKVFRYPMDPNVVEKELDQGTYYNDFEDPKDKARFVEVYVRFAELEVPVKQEPPIQEVHD